MNGEKADISTADNSSGNQTAGQEDEQQLRVVLELDGRNALLELFSALEDRDLTVSTADLIRVEHPERRRVAIDLEKITEKQQEALELALYSGYYERPRQTTLSDLAEELNISKSAVSQRLHAAETKLIRLALGEQ